MKPYVYGSKGRGADKEPDFRLVSGGNNLAEPIVGAIINISEPIHLECTLRHSPTESARFRESPGQRVYLLREWV